MDRISGGFVLQARKTDNSEIAHKPPHYREIFNWLYRKANHKNNDKIKRGQCVRSIKDIQDGLCWYIGYRKQKYTKDQCENAMKWLRTRGMITTTKTTRGMFITICNYEFYQNPKNYEYNSEHDNEHNKSTTVIQHYKQEWKNDKNDNNTIFDYWNKQKITVHRQLNDKIKRKINSALRNYSVKEIKTAIDNYSLILKSNDYYWTYKWTLIDFLQRGLEKFLNWETAKNNYLSKKKEEPNRYEYMITPHR